MAVFEILTTAEERERVLDVIKKHEMEQIAVSTIAEEAGLSQARTRYALTDLISEGRVDKIPTKMFNSRYKRFMYEVKR